jgi:predicted ATPase/DNA-binding SARP family transcriptional activator
LNRSAIDSARARVRNSGVQLPAQLTAFIGREKLLAGIADAVRAHRLVTLLGPGGSGKTRLSIEVARTIANAFDDGITWVELAAVSDPGLVSQTVATALGVRHQPDRSTGDAIAEYLAPRRALIVLDNCEHVIEEAAALTAALLHTAPNVHILATSREKLAVPGERTWLVPPLGLPSRTARDRVDLLSAEAVRLFLDRAAAVLPAFVIDDDTAAAIADICIRVDGIPLAIELAAARMNVLQPRQIAERLADSMALLTTSARTLPKRQRTLRAAIDWSYELLSTQERMLFRRLSVFAGSFTLEAVEAVCGFGELPAADVLDLMASLADKSLVIVSERDGEARYRMLQTVDQYATELLEAEGNAAETQLRHAQYYCNIVDTYAPRLRSAMRPRVLPMFDAELDNFRAALDWTRDTPGFAGLHHRIAGQLWWYWLHRVLWDEAMHRYSAAVARVDDTVDPAALALVLYGGGVLSWVSGMLLQSRTWLERCVELRRELAEPGALGAAMCALAQPTVDLGDRDAAVELARTGLPLARQGLPPWDLAVVLTSSYGYVHHSIGDWEQAQQAYREADALWSEPADDWGRSLARNSLAVATWRRGDAKRAAEYAREALALLRAVGDRWFAARTLQVLGYLALQDGRADRATRLFAASQTMRNEVGARLMTFEAPEWAKANDAARAMLGDDEYQRAWKEGSSVDFDAAIDLAIVDGENHAAVPAAPARKPAPAPVVRATAATPVLEINALGVLRVLHQGRLLTNEDWTYAKPRELLFYLLWHADGRSKEQIGLDLWPDASPARLRSSFHVTVHHLRRALGAPDWIAFHEGRYRFEHTPECTYDVQRFLALADAAPSGIDALQQAVDLYRGDYLDDAGFGDWTLEPRDHLRRRYVDVALKLATACHSAGRLAEAEAALRGLLTRNNLDERAHRLLLRVLADSGRKTDALRHHAVMTALLREELGIAPSRETATLVAEISSRP